MAYTDINIPMTASAAIVAGDLVEVSGDETVAPAAADSVSVVGYAYTDANIGDIVSIATEGVKEFEAGTGGVTAGDAVKVAANGVVGGATGFQRVGLALNDAAATEKVKVLLK